MITILVTAFGAVVAATRPLTWQSAFAAAVPAVIVAMIALRSFRHVREPMPASIRQGLKWWTGLIAIALLWEAWAFFHQPAWDVASYNYPTLSALIGPAFDHPVIRFGCAAIWLYAGVRLTRPAQSVST